MTLKELNKHYKVYKRDNEYRICSLTEHGRSPYKYLCSAKKLGNKMAVIGYGFTSNLTVFKEQVKDYVSKLEYDSEYFNPDYRKGLKEELFVHDYMDKLGFKSEGDDFYVYNKKDIYGGKSFSIKLSFHDLNVIKFWDKPEITEFVDINLWLRSMSWISTEVPRTFEGLKKGVDGIIKPLMLTEALKAFELAECLETVDLNLELNNVSNFEISTEDFKAKLKQQLLDLAEKL